MRILQKHMLLTDYEIVVEIESADIGKQFQFITSHIPYGMGCGYVANILVKEISSEKVDITPKT